MVQQRVVGAVIAVTAFVTLYSLSELHSLSVAHARAESEERAAAARQLAASEKEQQLIVQQQRAASAAVTTLPTHTATTGAIRSSPSPPPPSPLSTTSSTTSTTSSSTTSGSSSTSSSSSSSNNKCFFYPNTELWGDVVVWGNANAAESQESCCDLCRKYQPSNPEESGCNVFVYCGDKEACKENYKQCWLKHLVHPEATRPAKQGPQVPWTSGTLDVDMMSDVTASKPKDYNSEARRFHIVTTAQGAAVHWQARIHYYWYKKQKSICEKQGGCEMGGFTRLLHSGKADDLVDEIPTMVVDPLPADMVEHSWYVVLNRPYAFVQWVKKATIPERYVLMAEPDHIFLRPLPNFMNGDIPASFPFFYIEPAKKEFANITKKFTGPITRKQLEEVAPIGNSPTYMTMEDMKRTMPLWMNISIAIFKDPDANAAWGWVQEMYGFAIAAWKAGITRFDLHLNMMAQPPWDTDLFMTPKKPFYILHYTYGMDYKLTGEFTPGKIGQWRFDKRSYGGKPIPRHLGDPPQGMKNDLVRALINSFNEATDALPCWPEYEQTGKVNKNCTEAPKHFLAEEAAAKAAGKARR